MRDPERKPVGYCRIVQSDNDPNIYIIKLVDVDGIIVDPPRLSRKDVEKVHE